MKEKNILHIIIILLFIQLGISLYNTFKGEKKSKEKYQKAPDSCSGFNICDNDGKNCKWVSIC